MDGIGVSENDIDDRIPYDSYTNGCTSIGEDNYDIESNNNSSLIDGTSTIGLDGIDAQHVDIQEVTSNSSDSLNRIHRVIEKKEYNLGIYLSIYTITKQKHQTSLSIIFICVSYII
jgi:hypothetical protein